MKAAKGFARVATEWKGPKTQIRPPTKGFDASSTCLKCHARMDKFYNVLSADGSTYTPGGDFYWLKRTFTWSTPGKLHQSLGDNHGHNVIAAEYGLQEDRTH